MEHEDRGCREIASKNMGFLTSGTYSLGNGGLRRSACPAPDDIEAVLHTRVWE